MSARRRGRGNSVYFIICQRVRGRAETSYAEGKKFRFIIFKYSFYLFRLSSAFSKIHISENPRSLEGLDLTNDDVTGRTDVDGLPGCDLHRPGRHPPQCPVGVSCRFGNVAV